MTDPRCNCGEADCPICSAPEHKPWTPKPGQSPDPKDVHIEQLLQANTALVAALQETRMRAFRSYLLILLMSFLGGSIGGMSSAITLLRYLD